MAQTTINVGSNANDGTGDDIRSAFISVNANFTELYAASPVTSSISLAGNTISTNASNANLKLIASGTGVIELEGIQIRDNHIEGIRSNEDINISASGSGNIVIGAVTVTTGGVLQATTIDTNSISSADSTAIQINDALNVSGTLSADIIDTNVISSTDSSAVTISDNLQVNGTLTATSISGLSVLNNSSQSDGSTSISSSATTQVDSWASATYRSAKYTISISDATNNRFEVIECLITHGPSADSTTEAFITIFGSTTNHSIQLTTLTADIDDGNVRLLATNISSDAHVFKFVRTIVNI